MALTSTADGPEPGRTTKSTRLKSNECDNAQMMSLDQPHHIQLMLADLPAEQSKRIWADAVLHAKWGGGLKRWLMIFSLSIVLYLILLRILHSIPLPVHGFFGAYARYAVAMLSSPVLARILLFRIVGVRWAEEHVRQALHKMGRCPKCGYDLRHSTERCPECGERKASASVSV